MAAKMGHTPGPWLARKKFYGGENKFSPYVSAGDTAKVLCFMNLSGAYGGFAGQDQAMADACLIAAAPELLRDGKHLAVKLAEVYRAAGADARDCQAIQDWMAAIAKAEGR